MPLLCLLPAIAAAQPRPLGTERQTELVDPRDAGWFYRPDRVDSEKPEELLDLLGIEEGDIVADIGAGPGFFSLRAAERVGRTGKVLAVDVQPEMVDGLQMMMEKFGHDNIVPILGHVDDPKLPVESVDHVLVIMTYHEFSHPVEMMGHVRRAMKLDAQMLVVEYKAEDPESRVDPLHEMSIVSSCFAGEVMVNARLGDAEPIGEVLVAERTIATRLHQLRGDLQNLILPGHDGESLPTS